MDMAAMRSEAETDWLDVLAAYETYCKSLELSGAAFRGQEPVGLNEFVNCEYLDWREDSRGFAQMWSTSLGNGRRDRLALAVADMADIHVASLPAMSQAEAADLTLAYETYVSRAYEAGMPAHGWSAPAPDEFRRGDYGLWRAASASGEPHPYTDLFGAMSDAAEDVEMDLAEHARTEPEEPPREATGREAEPGIG